MEIISIVMVLQHLPFCSLMFSCNVYSKSPTYRPPRCKLSKMHKCVPSAPGVSDPAAGPRLPSLTILRLHHLPPALPPPVILACSGMPAPMCQLLCWTTVLFKILSCEIKHIFFIFVCVLCIICVKRIINLLQHSIM